MSHTEHLRNSIIEKLLSISNPDLLKAFKEILESSEEDKITLNKSQRELLNMSQNDIAKGKIITQNELDKLDSEWLD